MQKIIWLLTQYEEMMKKLYDKEIIWYDEETHDKEIHAKNVVYKWLLSFLGKKPIDELRCGCVYVAKCIQTCDCSDSHPSR